MKSFAGLDKNDSAIKPTLLDWTVGGGILVVMCIILSITTPVEWFINKVFLHKEYGAAKWNRRYYD